MAEREYVLGTNDLEIERLGLQHRVWRANMAACWQQAGFTVGQHLLDVGAGPGYATLDMSQVVGNSGHVTAFELSEKFVSAGKERLRANGATNVDYRSLDLVSDPLDVRDADGAWCRWVLSFVSNPGLVVQKVAEALGPGGRFAIHEYLEYSTWTFLPPRPAQSAFCDLTMRNWRQAGGDPNIGILLPGLLRKAGFKILHVRPILFTMKPCDYAWQWPTAWIHSSSQLLVQSGQMTESEAKALLREFDDAYSDTSSLMLSPSVIEIIAERT